MMPMNTKVYPKIEGIEKAKNEHDFLIQGSNAYKPHDIGIVVSADWEVEVDNNSIPTYSVPVTRGGPHSFTSLELLNSGEAVRFKVSYKGVLRSAKILPENLGIICEVIDNDILFSVDKPCNLMIEVNNRHIKPLNIFINPKEEIKFDKNSPNVLWFGPGIHEVNRILLEDHQIVYIEGGAIVKAIGPAQDEKPLIECDWANKPNYHDLFEAKGKSNITIMGHGIIDTSALDWHARMTMLFENCSNIKIQGVIMNGTSSWTLKCLDCREVEIDNVKMFGYRENSDGIDIVNSKDINVRNCFIRTGDDAICVKAMLKPPYVGGQNITVEKCTVWNDKVRCFGITCETKSDINNVTFNDCDILYSFADWGDHLGSLCIIACDSAVISDIKFSNIRIRHEATYAINCMIMHDRWSTDKNPGHIRHVVFDNISIPEDTPICIHGYDHHHLVEDVTINGLSIYGKKNKALSNNILECNPYTKNVVLKA